MDYTGNRLSTRMRTICEFRIGGAKIYITQSDYARRKVSGRHGVLRVACEVRRLSVRARGKAVFTVVEHRGEIINEVRYRCSAKIETIKLNALKIYQQTSLDL